MLIISEINKVLQASSVEDFTKLNEMTFVMSLNELKKKLSVIYHDFLNIFDKEKTTQLLLHQSYDHKIKLEDKSQSFRSWLYFMSSYKLQKIKKYLKKNLKKKFITLSKASFASSILFIEKKDDSLHFCVNYWKLNALIKRDRYSILLINEVLAWIQGSKYLTRLIVKSSFHIYILTRLEYLSRIFWLDLNTQVKSHDSTRYQSWVESELADLTRLVKQSNMTLRELNIEIFPVFRLCITFLHHLFDRKS